MIFWYFFRFFFCGPKEPAVWTFRDGGHSQDWCVGVLTSFSFHDSRAEWWGNTNPCKINKIFKNQTMARKKQINQISFAWNFNKTLGIERTKPTILCGRIALRTAFSIFYWKTRWFLKTRDLMIAHFPTKWLKFWPRIPKETDIFLHKFHQSRNRKNKSLK